MNTLKHFFTTYQSIFVLLFATILSITAISYFHVTDQILLYNDARSHLDIARRVTDSLTPGIMQIGSVWLPLYHLLELPFIQNDFLWYSGLAGAIVSGVAYIIATFFIYKIIKLVTNSNLISLFGTVVFALNPNLLYLQAVPLDEALAVGMATASLYFLLSWSKVKYIPHLMLAALFAFLGSLTRYELWFLVFAEILYVFATVFLDGKPGERLKKAEGYAVFFGSLALFGIFLWFLYNFLGWGDPLYFLHHPGGHVDQQEAFKEQGLLPTYHNFGMSVLVLISNIFEDIGPALLITAGLSLAYMYKDNIKNKLFYFTSAAPIGFLFLSLFFGITVLFTKTFPLPETDRVFNVRYGIIALIPAVIIVSAALASLKNKMKWLAYTSMVAIIVLDALFFFHTSPIAVIDDGAKGISAYGQADEDVVAQQVTQHCTNGLTLISANKNEIIMFESGFPMKSFIYEGSGKYWDRALVEPNKLAECILIAKNGALWDTFTVHPNRLNNYAVIFTSKSGDNVLYKRGAKEIHAVEKTEAKPTISICTYDVQPGDSLWRISRNVTGKGTNFEQLIKLNNDLTENNRLIHPTKLLNVPCPTEQTPTSQEQIVTEEKIISRAN